MMPKQMSIVSVKKILPQVLNVTITIVVTKIIEGNQGSFVTNAVPQAIAIGFPKTILTYI